MANLLRKGHFLGAKLRSIRKRNGLTLEELSNRCIQQDAGSAPSVSYLSMIESGKRIPSEEVLRLLAGVFQREIGWFLDEQADLSDAIEPPEAGGIERVPLQPSFLFSKELLQTAIPQLLTQTGTSGRQFAHLLIRSHQEMSRNDFPDLERTAESIGERRFPLKVDDLIRLAKHHGLELKWFERRPLLVRDNEQEVRSTVRSFFEPPGTVYLNQSLRADPARLKFDLATHIGHKVLHGGDGMKSPHATGGEMGGSPESGSEAGLRPQDVLHAWRDFECSFFAGALLCPKIAFRRFLARTQYRIEPAARQMELTPAVVMRRMTKVSPYPYWHFFDAYPPGYLRAVYRGNGIPLPWGNMAKASDPCPQWAVFRMLGGHPRESGSQLSVLRDHDRSLLYCCHSMRTRDMAGNLHVLSVGIDLAPALDANGANSDDIIREVTQSCLQRRGEPEIPRPATIALRAVARVLNIAWIEEALTHPPRIICPRSSRCPRPERCEGAAPLRAREVTDIRAEIVGKGRLDTARR